MKAALLKNAQTANIAFAQCRAEVLNYVFVLSICKSASLNFCALKTHLRQCFSVSNSRTLLYESPVRQTKSRVQGFPISRAVCGKVPLKNGGITILRGSYTIPILSNQTLEKIDSPSHHLNLKKEYYCINHYKTLQKV